MNRRAVHILLLLAMIVSAAACRQSNSDSPGRNSAAPATATTDRAAEGADGREGGEWRLGTDDHDPSLSFRGADKAHSLTLVCGPGTVPLLVNLPGVRAIASEERLSFGGGGEIVALVATTSGDARRGGVSASGPLPVGLGAMLTAGPGASYGAATIGPLPPVDASVARAFVAACGSQPVVPPPIARPAACMAQDGKPIEAPAFRMVGTEPFWGGTTAGRCVTYSTPERPDGLRLWTKVAAAGGGWRYAGAIDGKALTLSVIPKANCSDGMSDRRYPYSAEVRIGAELRRGCASKR